MAETIALVTGANKGIGREISRQLAAQGIFVLMGSRDRERGEKAVADLRAQGLPVEFIQIDVTSQPDVDRAASEVERTMDGSTFWLTMRGLRWIGAQDPN